MEFSYFLSSLLFTPILGAFLALLAGYPRLVKFISIVFAFFTFLISVFLFILFDLKSASRFQFVEKIPNIFSNHYFSIDYYVGLDGLALLLVGMTTLVFFLSTVYAAGRVQYRVRTFFVNLLLVEAAAIGVLIFLDIVMFYVAWELMLFPLIVIVGVWGNKKSAIYASLKYLIFSFSGSIFMLAAIMILYSNFSITSIDALNANSLIKAGEGLKWFLFLSFLIPFCIKVPVFPLHTWMPDFHTNAPTVVSIDLAGILIKLGVFGIIRFCIPLFPELTNTVSTILIILSLIGIVYGALVALIQKNIKRMIAFSSLSHMGFCLLGLMTFTIEGVTGSMLQLINHGFISAMLFMMIGIIHNRVNSLYFRDFGGLAKVAPSFALFFMIATFAAVGFPFTNSFIGEFLVLIGSFRVGPLVAIIAGLGVVLSAWYMLSCCQKLLYGPLNETASKIKDLSLTEKLMLSVFVVMIFWVGLQPNFFIQYLEPSVMAYIKQSQISSF